VLVVYAQRIGAPLQVLLIVVLLGCTEFVAAVGSAIGDRCGDSRLAADIELAGVIAILLALGTRAVRRRRIWLLPLAIVGAALWAVVVAHVIPGGAGGCFE
jgi:hypothetical protein